MLNEVQLSNRVQWVRDLLSGEFKQGRQSLKRKLSEDSNVEYCCLGVACERVAPNSKYLKLDRFGHSKEYMAESTAQSKLGMSEEDQITAATWNDNKRYGFKRIADLVAFATDTGINFSDSGNYVVPDGFAVEWLKQFD